MRVRLAKNRKVSPVKHKIYIYIFCFVFSLGQALRKTSKPCTDMPPPPPPPFPGTVHVVTPLRFSCTRTEPDGKHRGRSPLKKNPHKKARLAGSVRCPRGAPGASVGVPAVTFVPSGRGTAFSCLFFFFKCIFFKLTSCGRKRPRTTLPLHGGLKDGGVLRASL